MDWLQRSRRSSRRTSRARTRACTAPSSFNGAVVLHDGQGGCPPLSSWRLPHASTEPSFFTTDKACSVGPPATQRKASTEPSFFTTDKQSGAGCRPRHRRASTEPSFFTTDKIMSVAMPMPNISRFNGAVVLHDGQADAAAFDGDAHRGFNGAVVLHDGQAGTTSTSRPRAMALQRSRRSSRRTRARSWLVL